MYMIDERKLIFYRKTSPSKNVILRTTMCLHGVSSDHMFPCSKYGVRPRVYFNQRQQKRCCDIRVYGIIGCIFVVLSCIILVFCILVFCCAALWRNK